MEKINVAELLKDCPSGMELDCTSYDNVSFDKISDDKKATYPIFCYITDKEGNRSSISFTENGCESKRYGAKCVIFPKGKTTWKGFQRPFVDGDILSYQCPGFKNRSIYIYRNHPAMNTSYYVSLSGDVYFMISNGEGCALNGNNDTARLATEEEKSKLFQAIEDNGYKWNPETKTLEKFIKPKFKVGDRIRHKKNGNILKIVEIDVNDSTYCCDLDCIWVDDQDEYEVIPDKFDINTLIPFESRVLVRGNKNAYWKPAIFGCYIKSMPVPYYVVGGNYWEYCIPYEGNEHLLGTTDDCNEYFKTWE